MSKTIQQLRLEALEGKLQQTGHTYRDTRYRLSYGYSEARALADDIMEEIADMDREELETYMLMEAL